MESDEWLNFPDVGVTVGGFVEACGSFLRVFWRPGLCVSVVGMR